jgi:hypothetical protein
MARLELVDGLQQGRRILRNAGNWATALSTVEAGREMKATILLGVLALVTCIAFVAAPVAFAVGATAAAEHAPRAAEPVWMLISGATLIAVASAVRRFVP